MKTNTKEQANMLIVPTINLTKLLVNLNKSRINDCKTNPATNIRIIIGNKEIIEAIRRIFIPLESIIAHNNRGIKQEIY